ncbi:MAG: hypothetical protein ACYC5N_08135, partial [Endomicrobiales bacterium]
GTTPPKHQPMEKEERVDKEALGASILRVLGTKGAMSVSALKNFAANRTPKEEFRAAVDELARTGKINTKAGAREGSLKVWLAGEEPRSVPAGPAAKKAAKPRAAAKRQRNVKQRQTDISAIAPSKAPGKIPPKNGVGTVPAALQFRGTAWLDLETGLPVFGVQAKHDGRYMNVAEDGVPLFFGSEAERDTWLRERRGWA